MSAVLLLLEPFENNLIFLYVASVIVVTLIEGFTGFALDKIFHHKWWDYTNEFLNINGLTTIPYAFVWGLLALLLVKVVYPLISNIVESFPIKFGTILTKTLLVILIADFTVSWGALIRQTLRHNGIQPISFVGRFFDTYYPDEKLKESYTNMVIIEVQK